SRMRPSSGVSKPASIRNSVVLPQPLGPSSAKNSPLLLSSDSPSTARNAPNFFTTESMLSSGVSAATGAGPGFVGTELAGTASAGGSAVAESASSALLAASSAMIPACPVAGRL